MFDAQGVQTFFNIGLSSTFQVWEHRLGLCGLLNFNPEKMDVMRSIFSKTVRGLFSFTSFFGAHIAENILNEPQKVHFLKDDIRLQCKELSKKRELLVEELTKLDTKWEFISGQMSQFFFTGLSVSQIIALREEFGVYLLECGKGDLDGITKENVAYVA